MSGGIIRSTVIQNTLITPTVTELVFKPDRAFNYEPGQFITTVIPPKDGVFQLFKRMYSLASPVEEAKKEGYRLCVKIVPNGVGSNYIAGLKAGDTLKISAPYGDFIYKTQSHRRNVCFISTGTGIAPMRSMLLSKEFKSHHPERALLLYGARDEQEILYPELKDLPQVQVVHALSAPRADWNGFRGRVTDYLKSLPKDWHWHDTDFYLCGAGQMTLDVYRILVQGFGVSPTSIHSEAFSVTGYSSTRPNATPKAA